MTTKLFIDDKSFEYFEQIELILGKDTFTSGLSFTVVNDDVTREIFKPYSYNKIQVTVKNKTIYSGIVFNVKVLNHYELTIQCYTPAKFLEISNLPVVNYPRTFEKASYSDLMTALIKPFSEMVKIRYDDSILEVANKKYNDKKQIDYTETIANFLVKVAKERNILLHSDAATGELVVSDKKNVIGKEQSLVKEYLYSNFSIEFNGENTYSNLNTISFKNSNKEDSSYELVNDFVKSKIVRVIKKEDDDTKLFSFTENYNAMQLKNMYTFEIDYPKLLDENKEFISVDNYVTLYNPQFFINQKLMCKIVRVTLYLTNESCKILCTPIKNSHHFWLK